MIKQNINKVKEHIKSLARYKRSNKLQDLDKQFMLAQEKGEDTSSIVAEKQKLRDLPEAIDKMSMKEIVSLVNEYKKEDGLI